MTVNGEVVLTPGALVDPDLSRICVDGKPLSRRPPTYLLLNKPAGVLSTCRDTHGRKTVLDLVGDAARGLYPVGRLDADTEGLLVLTDDGELTLRLTHPRYEAPKVYLAEVKGAIPEEAVEKLLRGVVLEDGLARADRARLIGADTGRSARSRLEIELHTGKKRQIRRMLSCLGFPVLRLTRTRMGSLSLGKLPRGHWRKLTASEVARLHAEAGLE